VEHAALQIRIGPSIPGAMVFRKKSNERVPEKGREIGSECVEQRDQRFARRVGGHMLVVLSEGVEFALADFLAYPGLHQLLLSVFRSMPQVR